MLSTIHSILVFFKRKALYSEKLLNFFKINFTLLFSQVLKLIVTCLWLPILIGPCTIFFKFRLCSDWQELSEIIIVDETKLNVQVHCTFMHSLQSVFSILDHYQIGLTILGSAAANGDLNSRSNEIVSQWSST